MVVSVYLVGMAMKRKAVSQGGRAAKRFRRRPNIRRPLRRPGRMPKVHNFKRVTQAVTITPGTGVMEFRLNELVNVSEFTNLFDRYRIRGVQVKIVPAVTGYDGNPQATAAGRPNLHTAIDYNDSTAPANVLELMQYDTYKMTPGDRVHKRYFSPRPSQEVFRTAISSSYATLPRNTWLDCTTSGIDIPHFCLKWVTDNTGVAFNWIVYKTFYFQCVGTK